MLYYVDFSFPSNHWFSYSLDLSLHTLLHFPILERLLALERNGLSSFRSFRLVRDLVTSKRSDRLIILDLQPPGNSQAVYREDCTQCFDSIVCFLFYFFLLPSVSSPSDESDYSTAKDNDSGLNVCLHCFNGGCTGDRDHALLHHQRFGHSLALNIRRTPKQIEVRLNISKNDVNIPSHQL